MRTVPLSLMLLCGGLLLCGAAARAQPLPDDCWLAVRTVLPDGTLVPAVPTVTLCRLAGKNRIYEGRALIAETGATTLTTLTPGRHEARVTFAALGLVDGPRSLELLPGPNSLEWRMPALVPVRGAVTPPAGQAAPKAVQGMLAAVGKSGPLPTSCALEQGAYRLLGVFPGTYRLFLQTDVGYGMATITAAEAPVDAPVTLTAGARIAFQVTRQAGDTPVPLRNTTITLSGSVEHGVTIALRLTTDARGAATTLALPPGTWHWTAYYPGLQQAAGTVTLTADAPHTLSVVLAPPQ